MVVQHNNIFLRNLSCSFFVTYSKVEFENGNQIVLNSFELFGADFMLSEDLKPWLIEINCSPAMGPSTAITEKLCAEVIEDTLKVVLDRRENKSCDTGKFELAFKQQYIPIPVYTGSNLTVEGEGCKKPSQLSTSPQHSIPKTLRFSKSKEVKEAKEAKDLVPKSEKTTSAVLSSVVIKCGDKLTQSSVPVLSNEHSACDNMLQKEIKRLILSGKEPSNSWGGCLCDKGEKCPVVSGYHVTNASLDVSIPGVSTSRKGQPQSGTEDGQVPARLTKQALKLAQMHRKAKKKKTYATLKYHRSNDGPGLSISPGNGVTQM